MKKTILLFTLFVIIGLTGLAQHNHHEHFICKDADHLHKLEMNHAEQLKSFVANPLTQNYDLKYHRLEWLISPSQLYISGTVTSYFVPMDSSFNEIHFDLKSNMTVNAVIYNGQSLNFALSSNNDLGITLPNTLPYGQLDSIQVSYEGSPSGGGFGAFANGTHNGTPVLWTLSEPYGAKDWWPCKQDLNDKIDSIDVLVTTPSLYKAASNGILVNEIVSGSSTTYHWKHRYAIPAYLIAIAVTDYSVYSDWVPVPNASPIEVLNYVYPENYSTAQSQTANIVDIMQLFNNLFEVYPFADEKYGHAQFGWGGGMEHQTMSFMGGFSYDLQAHELAHQWFGDKITCASWEDIWLNEGFATYLTGLTKEYLGSDLDWENWKFGQIYNITSQPDGSVWVDDTSSVGRIFSGRLSYAKGSMLLHMLRWYVGDDDFYQAIQNYLADPELAFHYAHTEDLQYHLEAQSGMNLDEFFEDWFYGEGYPSYHIQTMVNGNTIEITLNQTTSDNSVTFFEMPVPVYVSGQGMDTTLRLDHTFSGQVFQVALPFEADSVALDPEQWLISKNNTSGILVGIETEKEAFSVEVYPNPVSEDLHLQSSEKISKVCITSLTGVTIIQIEPDNHLLSIDLQNLAEGTYLVQVFTKQGITTKKILKQ